MALRKGAYYRCIWTVRDIDRIRTLAGMKNDEHVSLCAECITEACSKDTLSARGDSPGVTSGDTLCQAVVSEMAVERASFELLAITAAIETVPEIYRNGILRNIAYKEPFTDIAHPNTWKKWKTAFVNELARQLYIV